MSEKRKCINCHSYKTVDFFYKRTGGGYQSYCKECKRVLNNYYKRTRREMARLKLLEEAE